jgi:hypothetical protein
MLAGDVDTNLLHRCDRVRIHACRRVMPADCTSSVGSSDFSTPSAIWLRAELPVQHENARVCRGAAVRRR